eukprot:TRINITY_DN11697_c0_g2_i1.p1 TRINITY_DN11697_c0_g2~~TRINITY_DN11697_c0_g2_i1.p1  ORF type:complete len:321 (+),score=104.74 TRINITY_DN11697_c0_g2_i1:83-964(+)
MPPPPASHGLLLLCAAAAAAVAAAAAAAASPPPPPPVRPPLSESPQPHFAEGDYVSWLGGDTGVPEMQLSAGDEGRVRSVPGDGPGTVEVRFAKRGWAEDLSLDVTAAAVRRVEPWPVLVVAHCGAGAAAWAAALRAQGAAAGLRFAGNCSAALAGGGRGEICVADAAAAAAALPRLRHYRLVHVDPGGGDGAPASELCSGLAAATGASPSAGRCAAAARERAALRALLRGDRRAARAPAPPAGQPPRMGELASVMEFLRLRGAPTSGSEIRTAHRDAAAAAAAPAPRCADAL